MLDDLDPEYLDHAIQYFQLVGASISIAPLNVMVLTYADDEDENFGINFSVSPLGRGTLEATRDVLKKRLNSRCMGLLEVTEHAVESDSVFVDASLSTVIYLRRTVRDYLASAVVQES